MAHSLADETLLQILGYVVHVSNEDFANISVKDDSPFDARHGYWSPAVPLVCKRWSRIATPLVYNTVVLRRSSHAQALAWALHARPEFWQFVRRLRIEGGFGAPVGKVLQAAVQLRKLHLSLDLTSKDNVKAMCKALSSVNPSHLSLSARFRGFDIASITAVVQGIHEAAKSWNDLTTLVIPYEALLHRNLLDALFELQNIVTVSVPNNISTISNLDPVLQRWPQCTVHIYADKLKTWDKEFTEAFLAKYADRLRVHPGDSIIP
ncbi:hypothetical protein AURDEDRAFT_174034 [Auricularia subglabra TFB-10046 SS5]|nr:hypothetical protein AURDEDRAFT_174034 [Auricularia subglabra TFB-10046 SS5]